MHGGWDWMLIWSFTLTLYSLDVVSVKISISFPHCKKKSEDSWRAPVVQPCPQGMLCSPSLLHPSARPPSHQHKLLSLLLPPSNPPSSSSSSFNHTFSLIFQRKKYFLSDLIFFVSSLHLAFCLFKVSFYLLNLRIMLAHNSSPIC